MMCWEAETVRITQIYYDMDNVMTGYVYMLG